MKKNSILFLIPIISAGIFLRIFGIFQNYNFSGELGKEMLYIRQYAAKNTFPLTGMATSHEWLSYGPIYYWIMIPIYKIFGGSPFILFWTALVVSVLGLVALFLVLKKIAGHKIAIFSTFVAAFSPLLVWQTRLSKLHVFFFLLMPVFMYFCYKIWEKKKKWIFWTGILFGTLFSFHFSQIPIALVVLATLFIKKYKPRDYLMFLMGVLIPNLSIIIHDLAIFAWVPYRVANLGDKNPLGTLMLVNEYLGKNIFWDQKYWILGSLTTLILLVYYIYSNRRKITSEFLPFYLTSTILVMLVANILHGAPPIHYFLPIFTTLPVILGIYMSKFKLWPLLFVVLFFVNFPFYVNRYKNDVYVPLEKQEALAGFIVLDANGKDLLLKRVGPYDYFPEQYSQNYKYLVLWKGGNLTDNSQNTYIINDYEGTVSK